MSGIIRKDLSGMRFGRLTVLGRSEKGKPKKVYWNCLCDCGNAVTVRSDMLLCGNTRSCKCLLKEVATENGKSNAGKIMYGDSKERIHNIWNLIKYRCEDSTSPAYKNYGARGITVCAEWSNGVEGYFAFKKWSLENGYSIDKSIDRIDNDKGYSPENCRWTNNETQSNNKRNNLILEHNGESHTASEWAKISGIPYKTFINRVYLGWDIERAISTPIRKSCSNETAC